MKICPSDGVAWGPGRFEFDDEIMRRLGKDPAPSGFEFDDEMLRAWIAARLDAPKVDVSAAPGGSIGTQKTAFGGERRRAGRLESILDDNGEVTPGVVFTCQALGTAADFYSSASSCTSRSSRSSPGPSQAPVIMCCLNRPTSRRVALKLGDAERVKTVAFGGDVRVRSAQGGDAAWLSRGRCPAGPSPSTRGSARRRLGEEEDATHVVAARDVVEGLAGQPGGRARRGRARGARASSPSPVMRSCGACWARGTSSTRRCRRTRRR